MGYNERDPIRGDDSWKSFHEVMTLAKDRDVDMVLLAGDLFHENKPSRKSMYQVMRSLRMNCYGEKPCELEMLSDASEQFGGTFNHVNYEDPDINVAIPVFSIHGNHDDPSGEGHLAALDILQMSGLVNYYGRTPESDNIEVKPVLLQKGNTKLALFGLSNVRDERLFRTFRDGKVKFFQPNTQKGDWFNLMSVHQNHHAYTDTGYLPEHFLPEFLHLVVWGHEHKCEIDPITNVSQGFHVMQPGSSVATSLVPGEAVAKRVAILTIKGQDFDCETIRLKTVRPFVMREIALSDSRKMRDVAQTPDNKPKVTRYLQGIVEELIEEANEQWREAREEAGVTDDDEENAEPPLPLVRLRVEYTAPEGGTFEIDNPQRFSSRFLGKVANVTDVVQFHRKRQTTKQIKGKPDMPEAERLQQLGLDNVKVEKLVQEFLTAQSLTILPQNTFSDAVGQFVDKDDHRAMELFVTESLATQVEQLIGEEEDDDWDEERMAEMMEEFKAEMEQQFSRGELKRSSRKASRKPKPDHWDSDVDGHWDDHPASLVRQEVQEDEAEVDEDGESVASAPTRGRGRGRGGRGGGTATTRKTAAAGAKKAPAKGAVRGKKKPVSEDEDEDDDVVMIDDDDDDDDDESQLFVKPAAKKAAPAKKPAAKSSTQTSKASAQSKAVKAGQTQLSWLGSQASQASQPNGPAGRGSGMRAAAGSKAPPKKLQEPSEDEISDDDAFEPPPAAATRNRTTRR